MNIKNIIFTIALGVALLSCQKLYNPDDLNSGKKIPVIQGMISTGEGPYTVNVNYAAAYNSDSSTAINSAIVYILDDQNNFTFLANTGNGNYTTGENSFKGEIGRKYVLNVLLSDGSQFVSDTVQIPAKPSLDSISASVSTYKNISTDADGNVVSTDIPGLSISGYSSVSTTEPAYLRFESKAIYQSACEDLTYGYGIFFWTASTSIYDLPNEQTTSLEKGKQVVKNQNLGFLKYVAGANATATTSQVLPAGWIVTAIAYRISAESYRYYQSIEKQLNATDHFFDPVPSQIKGNMHCLSNSDQLVLGLFEANSEDRKYVAYRWTKGERKIYKKDLDSFVDTITAGHQSMNPPAFWQRGY